MKEMSLWEETFHLCLKSNSTDVNITYFTTLTFNYVIILS